MDAGHGAAHCLLWRVRLRLHHPGDVRAGDGQGVGARPARVRLGVAGVWRHRGRLYRNRSFAHPAAWQPASLEQRGARHGNRCRGAAFLAGRRRHRAGGASRRRHVHGDHHGGPAGGARHRRRAGAAAHGGDDRGIRGRAGGRAARRSPPRAAAAWLRSRARRRCHRARRECGCARHPGEAMSDIERMPPLAAGTMTDAQRAAAAELAAGPRGGVKGPFIALLRSPELMRRLQKVGEYLRYESSLEPRISEFLMLVVSRHWTQQYEWAVHVPLALEAGVKRETIESLVDGCRPAAMAADEALAYAFADELLRNRGVSDATYGATTARFGERGVMDMLGVLGYFITVSMVLNVAHTPAARAASIPLPMLPR